MSPELRISLACLLAAVVTTLLVPVAMRVAGRTGFLDRPRDYKQHAAPTPYLGGAALMAGVLPVVVLLGGGTGSLFAIVGGALALFVVGTLDDRIDVAPRWRVIAEVGVAVALWDAGLGWHVPGGDTVELTFTILWVLGLVNAFNLFDNMDGTCSSVAAASAAGIAVLAAINGQDVLAAAALAVAGGCVGFLRYNLASPARIFLGDGGSMPLGFLVAALAMGLGPQAGAGITAVGVALPLVGIVALDTTLVIISRTRANVSVLTGGRDHLTHRLARVLGTPRRVAAALAGLQACVSLSAILAIEAGHAAALVFAAAYVAAALTAISRLERAPWLPERPVVALPVVTSETVPAALVALPGDGIEIARVLRAPRFARANVRGRASESALADVAGDAQSG